MRERGKTVVKLNWFFLILDKKHRLIRYLLFLYFLLLFGERHFLFGMLPQINRIETAVCTAI